MRLIDSLISDEFYCKPHFTQLYKLNGDYTTGFSNAQAQRKQREADRQTMHRMAEDVGDNQQSQEVEPTISEPKSQEVGSSVAEPKSQGISTAVSSTQLEHGKAVNADMASMQSIKVGSIRFAYKCRRRVRRKWQILYRPVSHDARPCTRHPVSLIKTLLSEPIAYPSPSKYVSDLLYQLMSDVWSKTNGTV
jgi:hypothetical protein